MRSRPRPRASPRWASSLSDTESGGVSLGPLEVVDDAAAPVTSATSAGGRVRTAPAAAQPLPLTLDAGPPRQRPSPPTPPPPFDRIASSPPSPSQSSSSRVPRSSCRLPDHPPGHELCLPAPSSAQLQSPHPSSPSATASGISSTHLDACTAPSDEQQARATPTTPPRRTRRQGPLVTSPSHAPLSSSTDIDSDVRARFSAGAREHPTSSGSSDSQARAAVPPATSPDAEAPWSNSTVRPGQSSGRVVFLTPTRSRGRRYTTDTEDESDGGIAFDSDMEQEFGAFTETGRPPAWALSAAVDEDEGDDLSVVFPENPPDEAFPETPTASRSVGSPLQPFTPTSPTDYEGFTPRYFPVMYETAGDSSPLAGTYDSDGDLSMDEPYMVDVTNMEEFMTDEQNDLLEREADGDQQGGESAGRLEEVDGDLEQYDVREEQPSPSPGTPPEDVEDPPDDEEGIPTGNAIQVVMDPLTNRITYASVIPPPANNTEVGAGTPAAPFTTITHIAHPVNLFLSAVLDSGFQPVVDGHFPNPFAPTTNNNVLFNPTFPHQETEAYNYDFERMFRALHTETYSSFQRCSSIRRRTPRVSPEALYVTEWSKLRSEEYPETGKDRSADIQGIDWDMLGISQKDARKYRRETYRNYRNVEAFVSVPLNHIHNSSHFFRFLRHSTKAACRLLHFQLRNILACTSRNDIFYSTGNSVMAYHPYTHSLTPIMNLSDDSFGLTEQVRISSLAAHHSPSYSLLLAGGFSGNYALRNLTAPISDPLTLGTITDDENGITNHIHLTPSRSSSAPLAVFSSNDNHVRTLDTATASFTTQHKFPWAVNCAATSPDARLRAVVGDSVDVVVVAAETGSVEMELKGQHQDFGFALDWAPDGVTIATGNQDQTVRLFDVRNFTKPTKIIPMLMAGCRNLRFSPAASGLTSPPPPPPTKTANNGRTSAATGDAYDVYEPVSVPRGGSWGRQILAIAEPSDYIHFVDCGHWEKEAQTVEFWGEVAGMSWTPDGEQIVVANCDKSVGGVMVWERTLDGWGFGGVRVGKKGAEKKGKGKRRVVWGRDGDDDGEDHDRDGEERKEREEEDEVRVRRWDNTVDMDEFGWPARGSRRRKRPLERGSSVAYV